VTSAYARDLVVGDVLAVLEAEGIDRFAVWGLSYGGWVGFLTAEDHPERVTALVTTGSWDCQPEVVAEDEPYDDSWGDAVRDGGMPALIAVFKEGMGDSYSAEFPPWAEATTLAADPDALVAIHDRSLAGEGVTTYDTMSTPTLLIAGELDDPDDEAPTFAARMPHGESLRLSGLGHGGSCASRTALSPARDFLARWSA
jgi:pimeloyl-ACP methyl ester carboxylesterase